MDSPAWYVSEGMGLSWISRESGQVAGTITVTLIVHSFINPDASVMVATISFSPSSKSVKVASDSSVSSTEQLSEKVATESMAIIFCSPGGISRVISEHISMGIKLSFTVISAVQLSRFPTLSMAYNWIRFNPVSAQVKQYLLRNRESKKQLSTVLLSTWKGVMQTWPAVSRFSERFLQYVNGGKSSTMVTIPVQVSILPTPSSIVIKTGFSP